MRADPTMAALRRTAFRAHVAERRTPTAKARALAALVLRPVTAARDARRALGSRGRLSAIRDAVAAQYGVSPRQQLLRAWWLRARYGLLVVDYYRFALYAPQRWERAPSYLFFDTYHHILRWLARRTPIADRPALVDKRHFVKWGRSHGLPVVESLLECSDGAITHDGRVGGTLPPVDLVVKPGDSYGGQDVERWRHDPARGAYRDDGGRTLSADALVADVVARSAGAHPLLVQRCLVNHPAMGPLTPGGMATVRIMTIRHPDGAVQPLVAALRMPVGDSATDNFSTGGLAAPIDLATGRLGTALRRSTRALAPRLEHHPTTQGRIAGTVLPYWEETVALAVRAHACVACVAPVVGWDVCVLADGPVLLEGSDAAGTLIAQMTADQPLGDTQLPACLLAHVAAVRRARARVAGMDRTALAGIAETDRAVVARLDTDAGGGGRARTAARASG